MRDVHIEEYQRFLEQKIEEFISLREKTTDIAERIELAGKVITYQDCLLNFLNLQVYGKLK